MEFEWDEEKAKANRRKHHIDFELAARIFPIRIGSKNWTPPMMVGRNGGKP